MVAKPKTLVRDALVGFVLGLFVVSAIALVTAKNRADPTERR